MLWREQKLPQLLTFTWVQIQRLTQMTEEGTDRLTGTRLKMEIILRIMQSNRCPPQVISYTDTGRKLRDTPSWHCIDCIPPMFDVKMKPELCLCVSVCVSICKRQGSLQIVEGNSKVAMVAQCHTKHYLKNYEKSNPRSLSWASIYRRGRYTQHLS